MTVAARRCPAPTRLDTSPQAAPADWPVHGWTFVRAQLPDPPATVIEIGCGPDGGLVPQLTVAGYQAFGVDPDAPAGAHYRRMTFEQYQPPQRVHAVVASLSLHHVVDLQRVLDTVTASLLPNGVVIVTEWSWERFDAPTARWYFNRLRPAAPDADFLHQRQQEWLASGLPWDAYYRRWAQQQEHCHTGDEILHELRTRFATRTCRQGPYFYADLLDTSEQAEQAAIAAGSIQATGIQYSGTLPP